MATSFYTKNPETERRPKGATEKALKYLDKLRESGVTNMFGAGPYLENAFDYDREQAGESVLAVDFYDGEGRRITVSLERGRLSLYTPDGALVVHPNSANTIYITTKQIGK